MPEELAYYVSQYGYLAIFVTIFLQEIGAPNPIPNEFVLLFSGCMIYTKTFSLPFILPLIVSADLLAASILYLVFFFFGRFLLDKQHRRIPISPQVIEKHARRIHERGMPGIVIGRLTPFIRGYTAVICGFLHVNPKKYALIIASTSTLWATAYLTAGYFLGPYWDDFIQHLYLFREFLIGLLIIALTSYIVKIFFPKRKRTN